MVNFIRKIFVLCALAAASPSFAQVEGDFVQIHLRTGWRAADGTHMAGVTITLADGWKTYWRQPGDVGLPPQFNWAQSRNIEAVKVLWPAPKVSYDDQFRSIGYENVVTLPLIIQPVGAGDMHLQGELSIGVCKDICIPYSVRFAADLPPNTARDGVIEAAISAQPQRKKSQMECAIEPVGDGELQITVSVDHPVGRYGDEMAVEFKNPAIWVNKPKVQRQGQQVKAVATALLPLGQAVSIDRSAITATYFDGEKSVEFAGCRAG